MTTLPLETSEQIHQRWIQEQGPPKIEGLVWWLMARQYGLSMAAAVGLLGSLNPESEPGGVLVSFVLLSLVCGSLWLMFQRRRVFVWVFLPGEFLVFLALLANARHDTDYAACVIGATGIAAYVLMSRRVRETFYRTMGEPTR